MKVVNAQAGRMLAVIVGVMTIVGMATTSVAASKVKTIALPDNGQPMGAKTDAQGVIHVVYQTGDGPWYVRSTDNGTTFQMPLAIVDRESRKPGLEFLVWDMVVSSDGHVHVALGTNAWKLKLPKDQWGYFYSRLAPGATSFTPMRNINRKPSEGFSLATDDKGKVTLCWMADKMYANVSKDNGESFSETVEIDASLDPCNCCTTSVTYGADGKLAILYREETNNDRDMYLVLWDQDQNKISRTRVGVTPWKIDSCPMSYYSVARHGDGYVTIWPTKGQIYFAQLDGRGKPRSAEEIKVPGQTGMRTGMMTLTNSRGETLTAWKKDHQLGWQCFDKQGHPSGHSATVPSKGSGVAGVLTKEGEFLLFK